MTLTFVSVFMSAGQEGGTGIGGGQYSSELPPPSIMGLPKIASGVLLQNPVLVTVGLPPVLYIPPPAEEAVFPLKEQLVTVGLLLVLYIPPPLSAVFPVVGQFGVRAI